MLLFLTTADTEILAAARATESLPEGFPQVRCANPAAYDDPEELLDAELSGASAVLVRLLGGRKAWPEGSPSFSAVVMSEGYRFSLLAARPSRTRR